MVRSIVICQREASEHVQHAVKVAIVSAARCAAGQAAMVASETAVSTAAGNKVWSATWVAARKLKMLVFSKMSEEKVESKTKTNKEMIIAEAKGLLRYMLQHEEMVCLGDRNRVAGYVHSGAKNRSSRKGHFQNDRSGRGKIQTSFARRSVLVLGACLALSRAKLQQYYYYGV